MARDLAAGIWAVMCVGCWLGALWGLSDYRG